MAGRFGRCGVALLVVLLCAAASARADVYDDNLAAASRGAGDIVVLARGVDGAIYERHLAGGAWSSWASIGGSTSSGPAAAAYSTWRSAGPATACISGPSSRARAGRAGLRSAAT